MAKSEEFTRVRDGVHGFLGELATLHDAGWSNGARMHLCASVVPSAQRARWVFCRNSKPSSTFSPRQGIGATYPMENEQQGEAIVRGVPRGRS